MDSLPPRVRPPIEAMDQAVNALEPWLPPRVMTDVRRRWVRAERELVHLAAEVERLNRGLRALCECGGQGDPCRACCYRRA